MFLGKTSLAFRRSHFFRADRLLIFFSFDKNLYPTTWRLQEDKSYRDNQITNVKQSLDEIDSNNDPYEVCEKRIVKIISTTI